MCLHLITRWNAFFALKLILNKNEMVFFNPKMWTPVTWDCRYPLSQVYQIASGTYCSRELGAHANQII